MLGPDVLVAPVVDPGASARDVVFPAGCWQHGTTATRIRGPAVRRVDAPLGVLPWFHRCGRAPF
jgi:alpha-D-xyloside xylohydrolase